jgi:import inner membrane translocase subunit TIM16
MALGPVLIRIMVQVAIPVVRAFGVAFQQALVNAKKGGVTAEAATSTVRRGGMKVEEALQVLNLEQALLAKSHTEVESAIEKQYERYFSANDPEKGGSFYLQSKIYRAKESLTDELRRKAETGNTT